MKVFKIDDGEHFWLYAENEELAREKFWKWAKEVGDGQYYDSREDFFEERHIKVEQLERGETIELRNSEEDTTEEVGPEDILDDTKCLNAHFGIFAGSVWA